MYEILCDLDNLYEAYLNIRAASAWKEETQRYELKLVPNLINLKNRLSTFSYVPNTPRGFFINERGKSRYIESSSIDDKIVQNILHTKIIFPAIRDKLIYDNAASIENRGVLFFRQRLEYHLTDFACKHGNNGYVLLMDFSKYFDNIQHDVFLSMMEPLIVDKRVFSLLCTVVYSNRIDVSYMSDEEYRNCMNTLFDNYAYRIAVKNGIMQCTGTKYMYKCMSLGNQISQDAGIFVPHRIDNYIKIVRAQKYYGRYMDDSYIISDSKECLLDLLYNISQIALSLGIFLSPNKTHIINLNHEFSILKTRYRLFENNSIAIMPNNDTFKRETAKLKNQLRELEEGNPNINYEIISNEYKAWKNSILKNTDGVMVDPLKRMDCRFGSYFNKYKPSKSKKNKNTKL